MEDEMIDGDELGMEKMEGVENDSENDAMILQQRALWQTWDLSVLEMGSRLVALPELTYRDT
ncbi:hypothetical protein OCU04_003234 [Sclerotinia nivalis]|uniref:Uncharacterized protein n=1 Tax=Sclerotinia nivalis TaxID=352851 RepID=A0A9X0DLN6_9HELO|nr:hypothetical protein OCU04_003234 [Sclerotinia nivalis]